MKTEMEKRSEKKKGIIARERRFVAIVWVDKEEKNIVNGVTCDELKKDFHKLSGAIGFIEGINSARELQFSGSPVIALNCAWIVDNDKMTESFFEGCSDFVINEMRAFYKR